MSDRVQRFLIWLLAVGLIVGTGIALRYAGGYRRMAGLESPVLLPPNVTLRLQNVRAVGRKNNRKAWTLRADRVDSSKDRSRVEFAGNVALVLLSEEKPRATLNALAASYMAANQTLVVSGKVIGALKNPRTGVESLRMETDMVNWSSGSQQIVAPQAVTLTLKEGRIMGNQMVIDLRTRDYQIKDFTAEFTLSEGEAPLEPLQDVFKPGTLP